MPFFAIDPRGTWCREQGIALEKTDMGYRLRIVVASPDPSEMNIVGAINQLRYTRKSSKYTYSEDLRKTQSLSKHSSISVLYATVEIQGEGSHSRIYSTNMEFVPNLILDDIVELETAQNRFRSKSLFREWSSSSEYYLNNLKWLSSVFPWACHNTKHYRDLVLDYRECDTEDPTKAVHLVSLMFNRIASKFASGTNLAYLVMRRGVLRIGGGDGSFSCPFRDATSALNNANLSHFLIHRQPMFSRQDVEDTFFKDQLIAS